MISMNPRLCLRAILSMAIGLTCLPAAAGVKFKDISPNDSDQYVKGVLNGASGGRVNNLAAAPGTNLVFYAASEWGGLFKTEDGGVTWSHLDGQVPPVTWDVAVSPLDANTVYATSLYDGRIHPVSGIQVSHDAGGTWTHPPTANPAGLACVDENGNPQPVPGQWSAFGIGIRPDDPNDVFAGTTCGVAVSHDAGSTWSFVDPDPNHPGLSYVWDVVVQAGGPQGKGIVDVCGAEGHARSKDGGQTWEAHPLPYRLYGTGRCSIAVSPDESYVIFLVDDITDFLRPFDPNDNVHKVWESDTEGRGDWFPLGKPFADDPNQPTTKRLTFVATNKRSDALGSSRFDLWYGEGSLWRADCTTPNPPGQPAQTTDQTIRCPKALDSQGNVQWLYPPAGKTVEDMGAHGDSGGIAFDRTKSVDACPVLYASDGGVFYNKLTSSPGCQSPVFAQPDRSPHALWLLGMAGSNLANDVVALQFGVTDDGSWAAPNAQAAPTWQDGPSSDSWTRVADATRYLWNDQDGLHMAPPGALNKTNVVLPTATTSEGIFVFRQLPPGGFTHKVDQFGDSAYVIVTDFIDLDGDPAVLTPDEKPKVFITQDILASPIVWTELGQSVPDGPFCGVRATVDPANNGQPVFYLLQGSGCNDDFRGSQSLLYKHVGTDPTQPWAQVKIAGSACDRIGAFGVDPTDAGRLYVSTLCGATSNAMRASDDGGATWRVDVPLTDRMSGRGLLVPGAREYDFINRGGPDGVYGYRAFGFVGYAQPSLVAFDPDDPDVIVAGGKDSGVFVSFDAGKDWGLVTDPINPTPSRPHISQPWFAHFHHDATGAISVYLGTRGRGVWRVEMRPPSADAGGPYVTPEGTNVTLDAGASSDPDGQSLSYEWDLEGDGTFDGPGGSTAVFDRVGQDGVFTVRVKVSAGGVFSIATTTVTVLNVAPTLSLSTDVPKDENTAVTVSGVATDPGWLDPLTATIDWGDGTPPAPIAGVYEGKRPDATLAFSVSHVYGDNGVFTATLCASDDDATTCVPLALTVANVVPTAVIDDAGAVLVNGTPTFITHAGQPLTFSARSADPGSDDLALSWDWDDGPPAPDVTTTSLVNPPNPDPFPSPSIQPRDITDAKSHTFGQACDYQIVFGSRDDDAGAASDTASVVIVGNAVTLRSAGYWQNQYASGVSSVFPTATLQCYLDIAGYMSRVFNEVRDASTIPAASIVLADTNQASSMADALDRQLLTAWLNFANGSIGLGDLVDTTGDKVLDATFGDAIVAAESVRLDPSATKQALETQKDILERINLRRK